MVSVWRAVGRIERRWLAPVASLARPCITWGKVSVRSCLDEVGLLGCLQGKYLNCFVNVGRFSLIVGSILALVLDPILRESRES